MERLKNFSRTFLIPLAIVLGILLYLLLSFLHHFFIAQLLILSVILLGTWALIKDTFSSLLKKQFALDYIALLAVIVSLLTGEYVVGAIIALMISTGVTLEEYGANQAKKSLTKLINRLPNTVTLWGNNSPGEKKFIAEVEINENIFIRKGEVVPLDGTLLSDSAVIDESSLTGEPYLIDKIKGDTLRSGTVNTGSPFVLQVSKKEEDSTYRKIIALVQSAQQEKAPLIRLADKYSTFFTLISLSIATFAYFNLGGLHGALAVLVIATPCPLIIATPIALLGGVNSAAKKRIIIKKLAVLETLKRVNTLVFDKTGTLTLGQPRLAEILKSDPSLSDKEILAIAYALERNSLHPLAKAIVKAAKEKKAPVYFASEVTEVIGKGIEGKIKNIPYKLQKIKQKNTSGMQIELLQDKKRLAILTFEDLLKKESAEIVGRLKKLGYTLHIFTGDKHEAAAKVVNQLGEQVLVQAEMTPEGKQKGIKALQQEGKVIAMIGDGINDAPALALADVGMVFSNEEQTAASEASDVVLLGGDFSLALTTIETAKKTIHIAMQSILWGIGLSILGMILASFGLIPPLLGALVQEIIDVAVIINALRASRV